MCVICIVSSRPLTRQKPRSLKANSSPQINIRRNKGHIHIIIPPFYEISFFFTPFLCKEKCNILDTMNNFFRKKKFERRSRYPPMQSTQIQKQTKGFLVLLYNTPTNFLKYTKHKP